MQERAGNLSKRQWLFCALIIAVAVVGNWWSMLFSGDGIDIHAFRRAVSPITVDYIPELLSPYWGWAYRPTFLLYFSAALRFFRADPLILHAISLALHLFVIVLFGVLVRRLFASDRFSVLCAAIFAAATWNNQAVWWICATSTLFAVVAYLLALHAWLSWRRGGGWVYYAGALLACAVACASKEDTYPIAVALLLLDAITGIDIRARKNWLAYLPVVAIVAVFVFVSNLARGTVVATQTENMDQVKIVPFALHLDIPAALQTILGALSGALESTDPAINLWAVVLIGAYCLRQGKLPGLLFAWTVLLSVPVPLIVGLPDTRFRYLPVLTGSIQMAHLLQTSWPRWRALLLKPADGALTVALGVCLLRSLWLSNAGEFVEYDAPGVPFREFITQGFPLVALTLCGCVVVAYIAWKLQVLPQDVMVAIILVAGASQLSVWTSAWPLNPVAAITPALALFGFREKSWKSALLVVALWEIPVVTLPAFLIAYGALAACGIKELTGSRILMQPDA